MAWPPAAWGYYAEATAGMGSIYCRSYRKCPHIYRVVYRAPYIYIYVYRELILRDLVYRVPIYRALYIWPYI